MPTPLEKIFPNYQPLRSIIGVADSTDVKECVEHFAAFWQRTGAYLESELTKFNRDCPVGSVDVAALRAAMDDLFGDFIGGPLMKVGELLDEDETESRARPGRFATAGE